MEKEFLQMVDNYQNIIHKLCRIYRDSKEDQEDLFQEIVFQLWKAFPNFRNESKVSTWMYRIALNTAISLFRKKRVAIDYKDEVPDNLIQSEARDMSDNEIKMYWALRQLNNAEKAIIALYLEDNSYEEIAQITGISENYVGVRINRIKTKLKAILKL